MAVMTASDTTLATLITDEQSARRVAGLFAEGFLAGDVAVSFVDIGGDGWRLSLHFRGAPDEDVVRSLVAQAAGTHAGRALRFERIAAKDWARESLRGLKPVAAGRFVVHGAHDRAFVPHNKIGIEIEAGLAFGTGHHGTTRGCLLHFDRLLKRRRPRAVLDVGCGAGVLAIAAARVLKRKVWLGDIDPVAVEVANGNARLNGVGALCRAVVSRGVEARALREGAPYDLAFANILARPLRLMAPSLAGVIGTEGEAIISGLLLADVPGVLASWRAQGFNLAERIDLEGWASLRLRR
jgi:ribosomal protein L11 methyltransferase